MRRKSAYILFLAVLGLLVIGIVMLFSTSAYARDSHGDVYFLLNASRFGLGLGLSACIFAALVNYHFWQKTWWLWFASGAGRSGALLHSRTSECASTGRAGGLATARLPFSRRSWQKSRRSFFSPPGLHDAKNRTATCCRDSLFRLRLSACPLR